MELKYLDRSVDTEKHRTLEAMFYAFFVLFAYTLFSVKCEIRLINVQNMTANSTYNITNFMSANSKNLAINNNNSETLKSTDPFDEANDIVPWDKFLEILIGVTSERLNNIKSNIKSYYNITQPDIAAVEKVFNVSEYEFEYLLHHHLKLIRKEKKFNTSEEFMLDFMDLSNEIMEKIVEYSLKKVGGALNTPTKWHKQTLRDKVFRQQIKSSVALVRLVMCRLASICLERERYSDYVIEWLRFLLNEKENKLQDLFNALPNVLDKNDKFIRTSLQLNKYVKSVIKSGASAQRDILDLIDEAITNSDYKQIIPEEYKKSAALIDNFMKTLDNVYIMTDEDIEELETITQMFATWSRDGQVDSMAIWEAIIENMESNQDMWQNDSKSKVSRDWLAILQLLSIN